MTTYVNGFDAGTDGAAATTATIASSGYGYTKTGTGTATFSAADAIDGGLAIELPRTSGSSLEIFTNAALNTTDVSFSMMWTYKSSLPGTTDYLWDVRTSAGSIVRMLTNGSNIPFIQISGTTPSGTVPTANAGTGATAFVVNTQYRVDVLVHISATVGFVKADFYTPTGTSPIFTGFSITGQNTGTNNINDVRFGPSGSNTVSSGTFVLDLCRINDTQSTTYWGPNVSIVPPGAPTSPVAIPMDTAAQVSWTAPASNGGAAITAYTVTSSPGGHTGTWSTGALVANVTGLTDGISYTFSVTATNSAGVGTASSPTSAVTPKVGTRYDNSFDSGVDGNGASTSTIASSGYGYTKTGTGSATFSAADAIDGALAIEIARSSNTLQIYTNAALNTIDISFSFMWTYKGSLPSATDYLYDVRTSAGSLVRLMTNASNIPFIQVNGATPAGTVPTANAGTGANPFVVNTQYRCDARVHVDSTGGFVYTDFYAPTGSSPVFAGFAITGLALGLAAINDVRFGPSGTNTVASGTFVLDALRLNDGMSSAYLGPTAVPAPTCNAGADQSVPARSAVSMTGTVNWASGHSGIIAWTKVGSAPAITSGANTLIATVADIGSPTLASGGTPADVTWTYTMTVTQDDAQTASDTVAITVSYATRWHAHGAAWVGLKPRQIAHAGVWS